MTDETQNNSGNNNSDTTTPEINFSSFLMGLATQAMVCMGEIPNPVDNKTEKNFPVAQQTIDILSLLEEKTKGNLTEDESRLFSEILAALKLSYVKASK